MWYVWLVLQYLHWYIHKLTPLIGLTIVLVTSICKNGVCRSCILLLIIYSWCHVTHILTFLQNELAAYDEGGDCVGGRLAFYLEKNYKESKLACQALVKRLQEQHLDPKIEQLTPETDFRTIEAAMMSLISEYKEQCVGPASNEVLGDFMEVNIVQFSFVAA